MQRQQARIAKEEAEKKRQLAEGAKEEADIQRRQAVETARVSRLRSIRLSIVNSFYRVYSSTETSDGAFLMCLPVVAILSLGSTEKNFPVIFFMSTLFKAWL